MRSPRLRRLTASLSAAFLCLAIAAPALASEKAGLVIQSTDTSAYPNITLRVSLPTGEKPDVRVLENGNAVSVSAVRSLVEQQRRAQSIVLAIDTSGSMQGKPLADAREAAIRFLDAMDADDPIALVAFDSKPRVLVPFTTDRASLRAAVNGLEARGETALYDGLVSAVKLAAKSPLESRTIVVLSDGGDTVSINSADQMMRAVRNADVPIYAVALRSPEYDGATLKTAASRSRGRFLSVSDSASLAGEFETIAKQLRTQYEITFVSAKPGTKDLEIDISAKSGGTTYEADTVLANPEAGRLQAAQVLETLPSPVVPGPISIGLVGIAVFGSITLLAYGIGSILSQRRNALRQVRYYGGAAYLPAAARSGNEEPDGIQAKMLDAVGTVAGRHGFSDMLRRKLEQAALPLRPVEYIMFHFLGVCVAGVLAQLLFERVALSILTVLLVTVSPILWLEYRIGKRRAAFEAQLPDLLNLISGSLRAGYGLLQATGLVAEQMGSPAAEEFARVQTESRLGLSVESSLENMAERMGSKDFTWAVSAISIQREVGGNLAEVLDIVAATIRERDALRRQVQALSAEGRFSAYILVALPFVEAAALWVINRSYFSSLLTSWLGIGLLALAAVMLVCGIFLLRSIVRIEV